MANRAFSAVSPLQGYEQDSPVTLSTMCMMQSLPDFDVGRCMPSIDKDWKGRAVRGGLL